VTEWAGAIVWKHVHGPFCVANFKKNITDVPMISYWFSCHLEIIYDIKMRIIYFQLYHLPAMRNNKCTRFFVDLILLFLKKRLKAIIILLLIACTEKCKNDDESLTCHDGNRSQGMYRLPGIISWWAHAHIYIYFFITKSWFEGARVMLAWCIVIFSQWN